MNDCELFDWTLRKPTSCQSSQILKTPNQLHETLPAPLDSYLTQFGLLLQLPLTFLQPQLFLLVSEQIQLQLHRFRFVRQAVGEDSVAQQNHVLKLPLFNEVSTFNPGFHLEDENCHELEHQVHPVKLSECVLGWALWGMVMAAEVAKLLPVDNGLVSCVVGSCVFWKSIYHRS